MLRFKVIILPLAECDIVGNTDYISFEKKSPDTAWELVEGLRSSIAKLEFMPEQHEYDEDAELAELKIRKCCYKNYKIFFYTNNDTHEVYILRILYTLADANPLLLGLMN